MGKSIFGYIDSIFKQNEVHKIIKISLLVFV